MPAEYSNIKGLSSEEVASSRKQYGSNSIEFRKSYPFLEAVVSLLKEPMIILLLVASSLYFIIGDYGDGLFMLFAIVLVSGISLYQDKRSRNALARLKTFTKAGCTVIRDGVEQKIPSEEIVIGDILVVSEGELLQADGTIIRANDFSVNESMLTGESVSVFKDATHTDAQVYKGTTVASGLAVVEVNAIGNDTALGRIGKSLDTIDQEKTPLELQMSDFIKKMVMIGAVVFVIVWAFNYWSSREIVDSLLKSLTLAMSILPEEIPVAFTTFLALGSWRLMKLGIVVKQMKTIETLGSATVICTDKTGTITENQMHLSRVFLPQLDEVKDINDTTDRAAISELIRYAMWASEPIPFDPMELSIHEAYGRLCQVDERKQYTMYHEYPLSGKPPMMTHIFQDANGHRIIAAKGAPEAMLRVSTLTQEQKAHTLKAFQELSQQGYRLLGVGYSDYAADTFPATQQELSFHFVGLLAFYDPPKKNMSQVLQQFYDAGIEVKIITGDNEKTTAAIAQEIGFQGYNHAITGPEIMALSEGEFHQAVKEHKIFSRSFPEAKLSIINALKDQGNIVAMTGDGVNDGPALKAAHIGIAMGKRGTEIAKQASSLLLVDDDFTKMVDAVAMGRKIYSNLKKAIQYIISIHIPIILTVVIPLVMGWLYPNIFSPVHIIFFELIMGPTCSIIYENEPIERNIMKQPPRAMSKTFFSASELFTSLIQGLMITLGIMIVYQIAVQGGASESTTRTMVFITMISANVLLTLVNRSFYYSIIHTLSYKNNLIPIILLTTIGLTAAIILIAPLRAFFMFEIITLTQLGISIGIGFVSVIWYELIKFINRTKTITQSA